MLGCEHRGLITVDVDDHSPEYVPVQIRLKSPPTDATTSSSPSSHAPASLIDLYPKRVFRVVAPCLLPPLSLIESIVVCSPRHWKKSLYLPSSSASLSLFSPSQLLIAPVKRLSGQSSYATDRKALTKATRGCNTTWGLVGLGEEQSGENCAMEEESTGPEGPEDVEGSMAPLSYRGDQSGELALHEGGLLLDRSLTADPFALAFAHHLGGQRQLGTGDSLVFSLGDTLSSFAMAALHDGLAHETLDLLPTLLSTYRGVRLFKTGLCSMLYMYSLFWS